MTRPFDMPDFYEPWPARLNPGLEAARIHTKAWAREMGILDPESDHPNHPKTWDEDGFDSMDYPLMVAYAHPDAPLPELELQTDWNVWAFYFDDVFVTFKRCQDLAGAKVHIERLAAFMPLDLDTPVSEPMNPVERSLADLWPRLVSSKSLEWRQRASATLGTTLAVHIWELLNLKGDRVPNPVEYLEMRRVSGGAEWSAVLVEHATFVEIPSRIVQERPMRVLRETFADTSHLRNDLFSYQRETEEEGESSNGVVVFERFLGIGAQEAANMVNDVLTGRLQQFEHTAMTEILPMFDEFLLSPIERAEVILYTKGLQDWQAGVHEWHKRSSRYSYEAPASEAQPVGGFELGGPKGLGAGSIQLKLSPRLGLNRLKSYTHVPYKTVGPTPLPDFYMPFSTIRSNPNVDSARANGKAWARCMGMLDWFPGLGVLDEQKYDANDLAFFAAMFSPSADEVALTQYTEWWVWSVYADDYFSIIFGRQSDMVGAKLWHQRLSKLMPVDGSIPTLMPLNPLEVGLADLWTRTAGPVSIAGRQKLRQRILNVTGSWLWELANQIQNRIPEPFDYVAMRRKTVAADGILELNRGHGLPSDFYLSRPMRTLEKCAADHMGLSNDIISFQKEMEWEGSINNSVLVVQQFLSCGRDHAVKVVDDLMTARLQEFEYTVAVDVPTLLDDFGADESGRAEVQSHIRKLESDVAAALIWLRGIRRYDESEWGRFPSGKPVLPGPPTLGRMPDRRSISALFRFWEVSSAAL